MVQVHPNASIIELAGFDHGGMNPLLSLPLLNFVEECGNWCTKDRFFLDKDKGCREISTSAKIS